MGIEDPWKGSDRVDGVFSVNCLHGSLKDGSEGVNVESETLKVSWGWLTHPRGRRGYEFGSYFEVNVLRTWDALHVGAQGEGENIGADPQVSSLVPGGRKNSLERERLS